MAVTKEKQQTTTVSKKKGWRKWLGRFGTFLMMGGWLLILILAMGIYILVSVLTH